MQRAEDRHRKGCYKQSYASYHVAKCESFQDLLDFLSKNEKNNGPIISYTRPEGVEHTYDSLVSRIKMVIYGEKIQWITRAEGLRAKVAELALAQNYSEKMPNELL